jgi:hypothetical protein
MLGITYVFNALLPVFHTGLLVFAVIYFVSFVFNYFVIFTFLQRRFIKGARHNAKKHYLLSLIFASGGVFSIFEIRHITNFPEYGLKFWPAENRRFNKKWFLKEQKALQEMEERSRPRMTRASTIGRCQSIW